jgi:alkylation response protein AidB-like acyl-CoA dehydrogenase
MISFEPSDDQKLMVDSVAQFARTVLRPRIREFERDRGLPDAVLAQAHELGLGLAALPESVGGAGFGLTTAVLLEEELGWGDPAAPFAFGGPGAFGRAVVELAEPDHARVLLAGFVNDPKLFGAVAWGEKTANRERPGFSTIATATSDGWRLDGAKSYVLSADRAASFVVFAQVEPARGWGGLGAFVIERGAKGLSIAPRLATLGLDAASFGGIALDGVVVSPAARLPGTGTGGSFDEAVVRFFAKNALLVAARGVGLARAAFELTREYVVGRHAFGKPIGHFQAVAFNVADRAMDVEASRGVVWRAAAAWDAADAIEHGAARTELERTALLLTAQAIATVDEAAMRCADDGVQLHGGAGFMRDYAVEKLMRDAKQIGLTGMTAEQADQLAAAIDLGLPLDLGLVLPTPETQNAFV